MRGGHGVLACSMSVGEDAAHVAGVLGDSALGGGFGSHVIYRGMDRTAGRESV